MMYAETIFFRNVKVKSKFRTFLFVEKVNSPNVGKTGKIVATDITSYSAKVRFNDGSEEWFSVAELDIV